MTVGWCDMSYDLMVSSSSSFGRRLVSWPIVGGLVDGVVWVTGAVVVLLAVAKSIWGRKYGKTETENVCSMHGVSQNNPTYTRKKYD